MRLAFIDMELRVSGILRNILMSTSIPKSVVVTTDQFSQFIEENDLKDLSPAALPDETLQRSFKPCNLSWSSTLPR